MWVRLDPTLIEKGVTDVDNAVFTTVGEDSDSMKYIQPQTEFTVNAATGTTLAIRPPSLANYYSKKDTDTLVALGCANGAVILCKTGIMIRIRITHVPIAKLSYKATKYRMHPTKRQNIIITP